MKDQNRKQKEPVLEILTNPRTSYRLVERKKRERERSECSKRNEQVALGKMIGGGFG